MVEKLQVVYVSFFSDRPRVSSIVFWKLSQRLPTSCQGLGPESDIVRGSMEDVETKAVARKTEGAGGD